MPNNIMARKYIAEAIKTMPTPFSAKELGLIVNLDPKRVSSLLREVEGLTKIPKTNGRERVRYMRTEQ